MISHVFRIDFHQYNRFDKQVNKAIINLLHYFSVSVFCNYCALRRVFKKNGSILQRNILLKLGKNTIPIFARDSAGNFTNYNLIIWRYKNISLLLNQLNSLLQKKKYKKSLGMINSISRMQYISPDRKSVV